LSPLLFCPGKAAHYIRSKFLALQYTIFNINLH